MWRLQLRLLKSESTYTHISLAYLHNFFFSLLRCLHEKCCLTDLISLFKMYLGWHGDVAGFCSAINEVLKLILRWPSNSQAYCVWELGSWYLHSGCCTTQSFLSGGWRTVQEDSRDSSCQIVFVSAVPPAFWQWLGCSLYIWSSS